MPLSTLAAQITATGIAAPSFAEILLSLQESFQLIYGSDIYIAPDSQDGQLIAIFASAINDTNQMAIAVYNSFSPTYAQGVGLSSNVKINGIRRQSPSYSTAVGDVVGVTGTVINNGVVEDTNGNLWDLPATVTIPISGDISVTVTAREAGAFAAPAGTINKINTPTLGWQTFASTSDAVPGAAVETDATLRRRQTLSVALPANTPLGSLLGQVANLAGVTRIRAYENFTGSVDANGLPPHSISVVVEGGTVQDIIDTIGAGKTPGAATYGSTSGTYTDPLTGINYTINFYVLAATSIDVEIIGTALVGYSSLSVANIKTAVATYLNSLEIGEDVQFLRMYGPSYLNGAPEGLTYKITSLRTRLHAGVYGTADIVVDFNKAAFCDQANITVTIT